jgi:hypothetical protein
MSAIDLARVSAWLVVALFVLSMILEIRRAASQAIMRTWTLGVLALAAHIGWTMCAVHRGSLQAAYDHTSRQTQELIGIPIGAGVYVNFAMLGIWIADVASWWMIPQWRSSRKHYKLAIYLVFGFLFINAAIVFASFWGRVIGLLACSLVLLAWFSAPPPAPPPAPRQTPQS